MASQIQIRRDSAASWAFNNPILADGELGLDLTEINLKIGNGVTDWANLSYAFTPVTLTNTLTSQLVLNTNFNSYKTDVSAATASNRTYVHSNFLPLTGGTISGETIINNNLTIWGNLSASGTQTFANTLFTTTSALSVVHVGSGPAMWIGNNGDGDIASFYDIDANVEILHVGGNNGTFPNVGVKTSQPNKDFTVVGEISATSNITNTGKIYTTNGNSDNWNFAYNAATTFQTASAKYVNSNTSLVTSTPAPSALFNIVALSQVAYDSLSPNYNTTTLYVII